MVAGKSGFGFGLIGQKGVGLSWHQLDFAGGADRKTHLACVYSGKEMFLFVDGKLVRAQNIESDPPLKTRTSLWLGWFLGATPFEGTIDELRISQKARYAKDFIPAKRHEPDPDTLALYHFDEGQGDVLKDSSGNGYHAKIVGAKWVNADATPIAPPSARYALQFDGKSKVGPLAMPFEPTKPFTIEAYLTRHEHQPKHLLSWPIYGKLTGISAQREEWNFWTKTKSDGASANPSNQIRWPAQDSVMTHVAGVFSGTQIMLFVDGKLVANKKVDSKLLASGPEPLDLGTTYLGLIHQVRISTVARYDKDFTPAKRFETDADTLGLYHFDEGAGEMLNDSSGKGYHGRIVGATWVKTDGTPIAPE